MRERASWILGLDRDSREYASNAMTTLGHNASIADLNKYVMERAEEASLVVQYAIPRELHGRLIEWGKERGLESESAIVAHMVADVLRRRR